MGNPAAAGGSLERAMQLGAPKEEVAGDLARVLLAKGEPQRGIDLVGDLEQWAAIASHATGAEQGGSGIGTCARSAASRRADCGWSITPSTTGGSTRRSWPTAARRPRLSSTTCSPARRR